MKVFYVGYASWCGLGFIRGINSYTYQHKDPLYLTSLCYGVCGAVLYGNPMILPFKVYKELYRVEVNVRNLEHEKITDYYNLL
jgi:hypothetical protein